MPDDLAWNRALNSCNKAVKILRSRGYKDEPYIDEGNMPANWPEMNRKVKELWKRVYENASPIKKVNTQIPSFRR